MQTQTDHAAAALRYRPGSQSKLEPPDWLRRPGENDTIDVSVCIANWNCRDMLRACLQSLHDQSQGVRLETIVVDNGSADGAADMVAREFPEVVLIRNPTNHGFARANNQAASQARGRFLFFLNNDTLVPPRAIRRLLDHAERHPEVGIVGPMLRDVEGRMQVSYRKRPTIATFLHRTSLLRWTGLFRRGYQQYRRDSYDPSQSRPVEILMGAAMLISREVFVRCGPWDEDFTFGGEDIDLSVRIGKQYPIIFLPSVEITHYGRVSTRLNADYSSPNIAVGFAQYLRKSGCSPAAMLGYKLVITLDAPIQIAAKYSQFLWRRLTGKTAKANKSLLAAKGPWHFVTRGLKAFWKV